MSTETEVMPLLPTVGTVLATATAVVVVGDNAPGAALAAIAAARAAAQTRIVTIVDLIGDAPALTALAEDDDPHGVADCFVYGISPKAVTRRTHADAQLFVIGGGTEAIDHANVLPSARWGRLIGEYERAGALLLFVAVARTPGLPSLIAATEGVITVGAVEPLLPPDTRILANAVPSRMGAIPRRSLVIGQTRTGRRRAVTVVLATAAVVALAAWLITVPSRRVKPVAVATAQPDTVTAAASAQLGGTTPDTATAAATAVSGTAEPTSPYAVRLVLMPTYAEALRKLRSIERVAPHDAATVAPWGPRFAVLHGAYADSASAPSSARADSSVVRVPFALRLADSISIASAQSTAKGYLARGIPAYALTTASGGAVYAGAFATAEDAAPLTASLRRIGLSPVLTARVGRP